MNKLTFGFVVVFMALVLIGSAGARVENASVSAGSESSYNATNVAGNKSVVAGGVAEVNLSSIPSTSRWAGFYGTISATVVLADANNNWFRNWTASDVSGAFVYGSTSNNPDFTNLSAANQTSDFPSWLTTAGVADNWQDTFNNNETQTFNSQSINANYTYTYNNAGVDTFKTYSLKDTSSNLVWAALANNNANGYNGATIDYQLLVPVNGATSTTYYFYFELE